MGCGVACVAATTNSGQVFSITASHPQGDEVFRLPAPLERAGLILVAVPHALSSDGWAVGNLPQDIPVFLP